MNNWEEKLLKQWNERVKVKDGFTTLDSAHIGSWLIPFIKSLLLDQRMKTLQEVKKALAYDPDPLSEFIHSLLLDERRKVIEEVEKKFLVLFYSSKAEDEFYKFEKFLDALKSKL